MQAKTSARQEQEIALKSILEKYDTKTQKLYSEILKLHTEKSAYTSKTAMRSEILDRVKEALK